MDTLVDRQIRLADAEADSLREMLAELVRCGSLPPNAREGVEELMAVCVFVRDLLVLRGERDGLMGTAHPWTGEQHRLAEVLCEDYKALHRVCEKVAGLIRQAGAPARGTDRLRGHDAFLDAWIDARAGGPEFPRYLAQREAMDRDGIVPRPMAEVRDELRRRLGS